MALLFDVDGVIIDSMPLHRESWKIYLERHGIQPGDIDGRMHGKRNDEIVPDYFGAHLSPDEVFQHGARKEALYREMMAARFERHLVPGVREFIRALTGAPLGVGSNAESENVRFTLQGAGLEHCFGAIVDGHQVDRGKPHPDVYLRAAALLDVEPARCVVFEDSMTGVHAALAAGARVVGVNTNRTELTGVHLEIADFHDPRLPAWLHSQGWLAG